MKRLTGYLPAMLAFLVLASGLQARAQYYNVFDQNLTAQLIYGSQYRTPPTLNPYLRDGAPVLVFSHRGITDATHPENSIQSALNVVQHNVEGMELDVYESADKVPYLMHDQTLLRMTGHPYYSDIYRWNRESADLSVATPTWSELQQYGLCQNGFDGHGITVDHPLNPCQTVPGVTVPSLKDTLTALYNTGYQGLVFLDLREQGNVWDVGALIYQWYTEDTAPIGTGFGWWARKHTVLKFAPNLFPTASGAPGSEVTTVFEGMRQAYTRNTGISVAEWQDMAKSVLVELVYTSYGMAPLDQQGVTSWARDDWDFWVSDYQGSGIGTAKLIGPEVDLKAAGAILNYGNDDLFSDIWHSGRSAGVYSPVAECVLANPSTAPSNLTGSEGVYIEGGGCGPIVPPMPAIECGGASSTTFDVEGQGCTDHRSLRPWWYDTARFGIVLTDDPISYINYLASAPGVRPGFGANCIGVCYVADQAAPPTPPTPTNLPLPVPLPSTLPSTPAPAGAPQGTYVTIRANQLPAVVRVNGNHHLVADQVSWNGSASEQFIEVTNTDGTVSFYSVSAGLYVSALSTTAQLAADSRTIGPQQEFQIKPSTFAYWADPGTDSVIFSPSLSTEWSINSATDGSIYAPSWNDAGGWENMSIMPIPILPGSSNTNYPQSGADLSEGKGAQDAGVVFKDTNGVPDDYLNILSRHNVKWARFRINVSPTTSGNNYGVLQSTQYVTTAIAAAKASGFKVLLDFQFSDTWADPTDQTTPAGWSTTDVGTLQTQLQQYVTSTLTTMAQFHAWPDMIQIGNEVDGGMLWPLGNAWSGSNGSFNNNYALLYNTAHIAITNAAGQLQQPMPKIMLHISSSGNLAHTRFFLDSALNAGMTFDVVGLSYYQMWDGSVANMKATIDEVYYRYPSVKIAIAETAYFYTPNVLPPYDPLSYPTTPAGQTQMLTDLMMQVGLNPNLNYVFYWGTCWDQPQTWFSPWPDSTGGAQDTANRGLFDANGVLLPAINVLASY
jgi:arabinogalactan endo-1,4-beta-galactosidase